MDTECRSRPGGRRADPPIATSGHSCATTPTGDPFPQALPNPPANGSSGASCRDVGAQVPSGTGAFGSGHLTFGNPRESLIRCFVAWTPIDGNEAHESSVAIAVSVGSPWEWGFAWPESGPIDHGGQSGSFERGGQRSEQASKPATLCAPTPPVTPAPPAAPAPTRGHPALPAASHRGRPGPTADPRTSSWPSQGCFRGVRRRRASLR